CSSDLGPRRGTGLCARSDHRRRCAHQSSGAAAHLAQHVLGAADADVSAGFGRDRSCPGPAHSAQRTHPRPSARARHDHDRTVGSALLLPGTAAGDHPSGCRGPARPQRLHRGGDDPMMRLIHGVSYVGFILSAIVTGSWTIASRLFRVDYAQPMIVELPLRCATDLEVTLFASSITITPGTLVAAIAAGTSTQPP